MNERTIDRSRDQSAGSNRIQNRILAIDGPAGAGKSTVARCIAQRFGLLNIETGAMYRAFAWKALRTGTALGDSAALAALSRETTIELLPGEAGNGVLLDGEDVTALLRTSEVSEAASQVSVHAPVRAWMVRLQKQLGAAAGAGRGMVMEGRDIGTVVFPQASAKIFLFASPEARTERRIAQSGFPPGVQPGALLNVSLEPGAVLAEIEGRDARDRSRAASPLRPAPDAVEIDSTRLSLEEVVDKVASLLKERWHLCTGEQAPRPLGDEQAPGPL